MLHLYTSVLLFCTFTFAHGIGVVSGPGAGCWLGHVGGPGLGRSLGRGGHAGLPDGDVRTAVELLLRSFAHALLPRDRICTPVIT